jgi:hypothetical protein
MENLMRQGEYQRAIVKKLSQSSSSSSAASENSYFNTAQLDSFGLTLYFSVSGFMEGIADINSIICKATADGCIFYFLMLQQATTGKIPNPFEAVTYTQKLAEQYSTLCT